MQVFQACGGTLTEVNVRKGQDATCSIAQSEDIIDVTSVGFPMVKGWSLADDFNTALLKLKEDGVIQNILDKWFKLPSKCRGASDENLITLDWTHFIGLYIILGVGILLSFILLAIKLIYLWRRDRTTQEHDLSTPVQSTLNLTEFKNSNNPSSYFEDRGYTNPSMNNLTGSPRHNASKNATPEPDELLY
ncbi:uncharacterized protein LOC135484762 [Lineus longissimus]|uniref:uncharacterized protein LOC135484762 n=1 Tax=Lineus longissimus TaxID=88925 RepID=UPI00315DFEB9